MSSALPIILQGNNLGERHRHFNSLVHAAHQQSTSLATVLDLPDISRLDTLFKIELAAKQRNVDFILKILQHEDMLFVSRALKCCTWLLESQYQDVINPEHLEGEVYPHMTMPAVNKMKQWLYVHLRDAQRCRQFYQHYSNRYDTKFKFLKHCTPNFIEDELLNIMDRITPKQLKVICEYCPRAIKLYYENVSKNEKAYAAFLQNEKEYFECTKCLLHSEPDSYFEILENHYYYERLGSLSSSITECIMKRHKQRVLGKPELYAVWLLDRSMMAKHLNADENKDIVFRLARAEYLGHIFSYKFVEPFIKRLKVDERAAVKKKVFVDKDVGDKVEVDSMPAEIQAEYWVTVFGALQKASPKKAMSVLCRLENILPAVNGDVIKKVIDDFLEEFNVETISDDDNFIYICNCMKVRIVSKYLLLGEVEEQEVRLDGIWAPFLDRLAALVRRNTDNAAQYLDELVMSLKYNTAFFNPRLSCLPVLERIVADLQTVLPMEGYFKTFVLLHATMLYYKAIKYCMKQYPDKFEVVKSKRIEGATVVGKQFGNYVAKELKELVSRYFESITVIYQKNLWTFLRDQFPFNESSSKFLSSFIGGLVEHGGTEALLLAEYLLDKEGGYNPDIKRKELLDILKSSQNEEVKFFLHGFLFSGGADRVCYSWS
ncbi:PREDICTED: uncharacterized protein LOC106099734 [Papilio polytes]|uniref:uncharacterized protein LOC106099734 n=1 Tax=Papilio polytes TaxID=76194 RepID=UPI000676145C|nr:PREDICTED: uncharacterized protein LOC106099734 [Papilio polytes]